MIAATLERIEIELQDLDDIIDRAGAALGEEDGQKLRSLLDAYLTVTGLIGDKRTTLRKLRALFRTTEKTRAVCGSEAKPSETATGSGAAGQESPSPEGGKPAERRKRPGHGRNGAAAYSGAARVPVSHPELKAGGPCPGCGKGKLRQQKPGLIVQVTGGPPLSATVYKPERLRCDLCAEVFTAPLPEGVGEATYDARAVAMIALLKYGSGLPFNRLDGLQGSLGVPLPASTQWDLVKKAADSLRDIYEALVDHAAKGDVLHNDDTSMRILALKGVPPTEEDGIDPERTGVFTSGIVSHREGRKIALFFTGRQHAGENLATVLARRGSELQAPIQMCDALSRNITKEFEVLLANCLVHGRRNFVNVSENFPQECRRVLDDFAEVFEIDARAREQGLSADERLALHQRESQPVLEDLKQWLDGLLDQKQVEPNSGLGRAITYLDNHWAELTLFLRVPGAPIDNNICERALKKAILHRKNALFYKTPRGAEVGDIFQSLIHTTELAGGNPFDYLSTLLDHRAEIANNPGNWLPWNYQATLQSQSPGTL